MRTVIFLPTASVVGNKPSVWFQQNLDTAVEYYQKTPGEKIFLISGKWNNAKDVFSQTEAQVAKNYVLSKLPDAQVLIEEMAVETGGNFAFSKPFLTQIKPDKIVIVHSAVKEMRIRYLANKIFGPEYKLEFIFVSDVFSENPRAVAKEPKALAMFRKLFDGIKDGDDKAARETLLYKTPFYNYDLIDNEKFFNQNWPGGFEDFKEKRLSIDNK